MEANWVVIGLVSVLGIILIIYLIRQNHKETEKHFGISVTKSLLF